ncbi:MAG: HlyD family efflux transporter periplasmic adaptor subunit [Planctomycetota bacterium]
MSEQDGNTQGGASGSPPPAPGKAGETARFHTASVRALRPPPRKHWTRTFLVGVVLAFCALMLSLLLGPLAGPKAAGVALLPVQGQPFCSILHETGAIEALNERVILNRFSGDIVWMADDGKLVEAGEPVVRLETQMVQEDIDSREIDLLDKRDAVRRAKADIATAQERYKHVIRQAEITLEEAILDQKRIHEAPRPDDKLDAELTLKSAALDLANAEVDLKGYTELAKLGFVSEAMRKAKLLVYATSKGEHARAKMIYDLTMLGNTPDAKRVADLAVADARKQLNIAKFNREADLAVAQAAYDLAQVDMENFERDLNRRKQDLEWATVRAPVRGHVVFIEVYKFSSKSRAPIEVGESRTAGADLCMICDTSVLRIRVWINESDVRSVTVGQHALVRLSAFPDRAFEAVVSELAVIATDKNLALSSLALRRAGEAFVNVVQIKLDFVNLPEADREQIRVGFTADVYIQTSPVSSALTVPWTAVGFDAQSQPFAEVAVGAGRARRALKLGRSDAHRVEILEGLKENEQVYDQTGATRPGVVVPAMTYSSAQGACQ